MSTRQNVVLIVTDQHRADALGCVDPSYKTPNIDWLAASGIRFTNAAKPNKLLDSLPSENKYKVELEV